jgi:hypothetical protein
VFKWAKIVLALHLAATVIGILGKGQKNIRALKVPRQCPLVLLIRVRRMFERG